jgi:NAD(P)-dependent dehydrogenase (short-subunit alcohol dehydrogenase family)
MSSRQFNSAVVTGASAGIGRAVAVQLARHGWKVGLIARGRDGLSGAKRDVEAEGSEALVLPCDVADSKAVFIAAEETVSKWGGIDLWINNAMATIFSPFEGITPEEFRRVTEVTYLGQVHGTMAALRHMRERDCGTIIQIGSALSYRAIPLQSAYCGAKFAVRGFTDSLRSELHHSGSHIRLCMVQLPAVNTPQFDWARTRLPCRPQPIPPIYDPDVIAKTVVATVEDPPPEVWMGASSTKAILGNFAIPRLLDRYLARVGYQGQLSSEPAGDESDNLFAPMAGDHGAAGRFTQEERHSVASFDPSWIRGGLLAAAGLLIGGALLGRTAARKRSTSH